MEPYHKIQSLWHRDPATNNKRLVAGAWSLPEFEYLQGNQWQFTEKVDGTNIRVMIQHGGVAFGGRTDNASLPAKLVKRLEERFIPMAESLETMFPGGACLYGEGYGTGIQSGGNYREDQDFVLFDVKIDGMWLERANIEDIGRKVCVDVVPIVGQGTLHQMVGRVQEGGHSIWGRFIAEGIVARPMVEMRTRRGDRIITKLKHKDFVA